MPAASALRLVTVSALLALVVGGAAPAGAQPSCDSSTALTLLGLDTRAQRALFMLPASGGKPWVLELDLQADAATAFPDPGAENRFGGSTGPGPVIAASRCGERCLQPVVFRGGRWERLGEPLLASSTMTFHATWDRAGVPWIVLHSFADGAGTAAKAYRLEAGDWSSEGGLSIRGVGSPGAYPAPAGEAGIVSGDGLNGVLGVTVSSGGPQSIPEDAVANKSMLTYIVTASALTLVGLGLAWVALRIFTQN